MNRTPAFMRAFFNRRGYAGDNGLVHSEMYVQYSSTNGKVLVVLFRIRNTTDHSINWRPYFYYTAFGGWSEWSGIAVNGSEIWHSGGTNTGASHAASPTLSIPADRTSTVIFSITSSSAWNRCSSMHLRQLSLGFYNNSLRLPAGLEYVDDLDTAESF